MSNIGNGYIRGERVRDVVGYEGLYGVSNKGNVYNLRTGVGVEPQREAYVTLSKCGKGKSWRIGDLVAMAWVRNIGGLKYVKHKDGDIRHNEASNLEWSNEREYARGGKRGKMLKKVLQLDLMGTLVCKYNSLSDASVATGVDKGSISKCCHGSAMSAGGWRWRFEK